jgi:ubiquitin C
LPQISLYTKINTTVALKVKRHETISNLKALLSEKAGISDNLQELFFAGNRLMNDRRLVDYGIQQGSTVHLVLQNAFGMKILVKTPLDQKIIAIEARSFDTIQNIKSIIQAKEGIHSDQYTLVHNGKVLEDERILSSLNTPNETILHLVFNPKDVLPIFVRTVAGEMLNLEVKVLFTIRDVKTIVGSMADVLNIDWDLIYAGKKLEDCKTLASYDIKEETILEMLPASIQIFVKALGGGETIALDVQRYNTIKDVKDKIFQKQTGVLDNNDWYLIYAGKKLENWRTLASYEIKEETILEMLPALIQIFVKVRGGKTITLDVQRCNTIKDVKDKVFQKHTGVLDNDWYLIYSGKQLEDWRTLASYDIKEETVLEMFRASFPIFVKLWSGKTINFIVQRSNTVKDVKDKLSDRLMIPVHILGILFNGKQLEDDRDLASYGVQMDSTLHMVLRNTVDHSESQI